jgi:hypothetical protein
MDEGKRKTSWDVPVEILDRCIPYVIMSSIWNISTYRTFRKYFKYTELSISSEQGTLQQTKHFLCPESHTATFSNHLGQFLAHSI